MINSLLDISEIQVVIVQMSLMFLFTNSKKIQIHEPLFTNDSLEL